MDEEDKGVTVLVTPGGQQGVTIINEPGAYSLILSSRTTFAKRFKHWLTHEVLPSIRKQGFYSTLTPEETIRALAKGMKYDHFMEDVVIPAIEMQEEFTFDKLTEHYCGFPVKTMDGFKHTKTAFAEK